MTKSAVLQFDRIAVLIAATMLVAPQLRAGGSEKSNAPVATFSVPAQVIGAGGATMTGANGFSLDGTVGEVNSPTMTGANGLVLSSGFWKIEAQVGDNIFSSGFDTAAAP